MADIWFRVVTADSLERGPAAAMPMAGTFMVDGEALRFRPRFPFAAGTGYAFLDDHPPPPLLLARPAAARRASTVVTHIYPTAGQLPVKALRFYVHFSASTSNRATGASKPYTSRPGSPSGSSLTGRSITHSDCDASPSSMPPARRTVKSTRPSPP